MSALDRRDAYLYGELSLCLTKQELARIKEEQKKWIIRRNRCSTGLQQKSDIIDRVATAFKTRITELTKLSEGCFVVRNSTSDSPVNVYVNRRHGLEFAIPEKYACFNSVTTNDPETLSDHFKSGFRMDRLF